MKSATFVDSCSLGDDMNLSRLSLVRCVFYNIRTVHVLEYFPLETNGLDFMLHFIKLLFTFHIKKRITFM